MSTGILYFVTDDEGQHIMTAPASTLENVFGLTAEQLMRMLRETSEGLECKLSRQGRRVMDKTIRVRREHPVSEIEKVAVEALELQDASIKEIERLREEFGKLVIANAEVAALNADHIETIQRLTRDLETGFMQGAYARLKSLQEAESEVERLRAAAAVAIRAAK